MSSEEEITNLRSRVEELEQLVEWSISAKKAASLPLPSPPVRDSNGPTRSAFPSALFFLDQLTFTQLHCHVQPGLVQVPVELVHVLRDEYDQPRGIEQLLSRYFDAFHGWMPIIGKMRMKRVLERLPAGNFQADAAFLFTCMKLLLQKPQSGSQPEDLPLYKTVKLVTLQLEMADLQSLGVIQGEVLIAVYELGHGIYPACYMTVGRCARQAISIGLHNRAAPQFLQPWADWEEEIRVWWFIIMLDRYTD